MRLRNLLSWMGQHEVTLIEIGVVMSAATRWMFAISASEGAYVSGAFRSVWDILVFLLAGAMALVEGVGIKFAFDAWSKTRSRTLIVLILLTSVSFVTVLTPGVVASSTGQRINQVLDPAALWVWSAAVALSTMTLLGAVAYGKAETESAQTWTVSRLRTIEPAHRPAEVSAQTVTEQAVDVIRTKEDYFALNAQRNGQGHITAQDLMSKYKIPKSRAFAWQKQWLESSQ